VQAKRLNKYRLHIGFTVVLFRTMNEQEFAAMMIRLGYRLHENGTTWISKSLIEAIKNK
jgi:hypothetical protein